MQVTSYPLLPQAEGSRPRRYEAALVARSNRAAVLLNGNAKRVDGSTIRAFRGLVPPGDLFVSSDLASAEAHVRRILEVGYRYVILGGGDGTVAAAVNQLMRIGAEPELRRQPPPDIGILRLGTGNALAALTGAGRPIADATRILRGERLETVSMRLLEAPEHGEAFSFGSIGYDAQVLNDFVSVVDSTRSAWARRLAKSFGGYLFAIGTRTIPTEIRRAPTRVRIVSRGGASIIDPETAEEIPLDPNATLFEGMARAVVVGSTPFYGYGIRALPHAMRRSDRFQLRVSTASIPYLLAHLPRLWKGTLHTERLIDFLVEDIQIETSQPLPMQLSGDARGEASRLRVRMSERAFRLLKM